MNFNLYRRLPIDVVTQRGERIAALAYQSSITTTGRKPSPRYMRLLIEGARQHAFPEEYVVFLERFELAIDERDGEPGSGPSTS